MKVVIAFAALVAVALAAPQGAPADILKYESDNIGVDGYRFSYETSDGVSRSESAELKNVGSENEAISIHGSISWTDKDGTPFHMEFVADENGYQPVGDHIPK